MSVKSARRRPAPAPPPPPAAPPPWIIDVSRLPDGFFVGTVRDRNRPPHQWRYATWGVSEQAAWDAALAWAEHDYRPCRSLVEGQS